MFTIKTAKTAVINLKNRKNTREYEMMIAASQAKLAETTLVPGYTKIYC